MTEPSENPYTSSRASVDLSNRELVFCQLLPPAIFLLAGASFTPMGIVFVFGFGHDLDLIKATEHPSKLLMDYAFPIAANAIGNMIAIYAAIQMLYLAHYKHCVIGAIIATIPVLSPGYGLGIPFAVWALFILLRKDTRAVFAESN